MKLRYDEIIGTEILGTDIFTIVLYTTSRWVELQNEELTLTHVNVDSDNQHHFNSYRAAQIAHDFIRNKARREQESIKQERIEYENYLYEAIHEPISNTIP